MIKKTIILLLATASLLIAGCITAPPNNSVIDEQEYSPIPWNVPQDWEGAPSIPGVSGY